MTKKKNFIKIMSSLSIFITLPTLNIKNSYGGGIHNFTIHQAPIQSSHINDNTSKVDSSSFVKKEDTYFSIVYSHVIVAELKGNQKTIEKYLPIIASSKTSNDFIHSVPKHYRGANIIYNGKISYLLNKYNKLVFKAPFVSINGGSCFNLYNGKQENSPDGFSGALINNINDNKITIDMTEMKSLNNYKCDVEQTHHLYNIDVNSINNLFSMGYDNQRHIEKIIYFVNENRRHVKQNN